MSKQIRKQIKVAQFWLGFHRQGMLKAILDGRPESAAMFAQRAAHHARMLLSVVHPSLF
jgi:hypothetical protein